MNSLNSLHRHSIFKLGLAVLGLLVWSQAGLLAQRAINCVRLTDRTEFDGNRRVFEVGTLNVNGTFTVNPNFGMTWALFNSDQDIGLFRTGAYYLGSEIGLDEIPAFEAFYKTNFTLKLVRMGVIGNGSINQLFNRYEVIIGGEGGVVRQNGSSVLTPSLEHLPDAVPPLSGPVSFDCFSAVNITVSSPQNAASTFYTATNLPPGVVLGADGVLRGTISTGGYWNTTITAEWNGRRSTRNILFQNPQSIRVSGTDSVYVTPRTASAAAQVVVPPNTLPPGLLVGVRGSMSVGDAVRYIAAPYPPPWMSYASLRITNPAGATTTGANPLSTGFFNNTGALPGTWVVTGYTPSFGNTTNTHSFRASGELVFCILPRPNDFTPPAVFIDVPTPNFSTREAQIMVYGRATDDLAVARVEVSQNTQGLPTDAWMSIKGRESWSYSMFLKPGRNVLHVRSVDLNGNYSPVVSRTFLQVAFAPLTVQVANGKVTTGMQGSTKQLGLTYQITASPSKGYVFRQWLDENGTSLGTSPTLEFEMRGGLVLTPEFIPNPFPAFAGGYKGLLWDVAGQHFFPVGIVTTTVGSTGSYAATVQLGTQTWRFSGTLNGFGIASKTVNRSGGLTPLVFSVDVGLNDPGGGSNWLTVESSDGTNIWAQLTKITFNSSRPVPVELRGRYHVAVLPPVNTQPSLGYGWLVLKTGSNGTFSLEGELADGSGVKTSGNMLSGAAPLQARMPFLAKPRSGKDVLVGEMVLDGSSQTVALSGDLLTWRRPGDSTFPTTLDTQVNAFGAKYLPPASGTRLWGLPEPGSLEMEYFGGSLAETWKLPATLSQTNRIQNLPTGHSLALISTTGGISGIMPLPTNAGAGTSKVRGLVVGNYAYGYHIAPAAPGSTAKRLGGFWMHAAGN